MKVPSASTLVCLLGVYAVAAVSSQSILDLTTVVMGLFWAVDLIKKFRRKENPIRVKWIGIEWAFIAYLLVVALGFYFNGANDAPVFLAFKKFIWILNLYVLIRTFENIEVRPQAVVLFLAVALLFPTIYSLISYGVGADLITGRDNARITGLVNSATYHAHGNAILFVFLAALLFFTFKKLSTRWRLMALSSLFLLGISILLTFTRGIWISIFVSSMIMMTLIDWKKMAYFFLTVLVLFSVTYLAWPKFQARIAQTNQASNEERVSLFKVNVQIWKEYPWLGIGYGENLRRNREYWDRPEWNKPADYITSHAHNQYLNVLATTGIFGFLCFISFISFFLIKNVKLLIQTSKIESKMRYGVLFGCLWAQIEFLLACLTDVGFEYAKIRALILLVWALLIAIERKPQLVKEENGV